MERKYFSIRFDQINRNTTVFVRSQKLTCFDLAQYYGGKPTGNSVVLNPFYFLYRSRDQLYFTVFMYFTFFFRLTFYLMHYIFQIMDGSFRIQNSNSLLLSLDSSCILNLILQLLDPDSWLLTSGYWLLAPGSWLLDPGS